MARKRKKKQQLEEDIGFGPAFVTASQERSRLTPLDVQQKVFRLAFRGYNEQDVDQFLDQITEDLAALHEDNKRLREDLELRGSPSGFDDAKRHAEETVRRAREQAAEIIADAERRVRLAGGEGDSPPAPSYLIRERDFLQELGGLVQRHAERLKDEARRAREHQGSAGPDTEPEGAPAPERQEENRASEPEPAAPVAGGMGPESEGSDREVEPGWPDRFEERQELDRPMEQGVQRDRDGRQGPAPIELASERREEEPSLRELFWGEE